MAWREDNRRVPNGMQYSLGLVVGPVRREEKWFNGANAEESNSHLLIGQSKPGDRPGGDEYGSETRWFEFGSHPYIYAYRITTGVRLEGPDKGRVPGLCDRVPNSVSADTHLLTRSGEMPSHVRQELQTNTAFYVRQRDRPGTDIGRLP